jgi:hypothetical protein
MIDSSNFSFMVFVVAVTALALTMYLLADEDRRLPPISTRRGKWGRVIVGLVLVAFICTSILYIDSGQLENEFSRLKFITGIVAAVGTTLFVLFRDWKKDKKHK